MDVRVESCAPVPAETQRLLALLPEWFGRPDSNTEYVQAAGRLPTLVARTAAAVVGLLLLDRPTAQTREIHLLLVDPALHRRGVGRALFETAADRARADGAALLSVKTLGASHPDEHYARTREFYLALGFVPVEEFDELWPGTPCLLLVRPL